MPPHPSRPVRTALAVCAALALAVTACEGSAVQGDGDDADGPAPSSSVTLAPITVGLVNPLTGPYAALGEDVNDGFQLYLDEHDGVLAGHPVEVVTEDTANDVATAQEAVTQLTQQGVDLLAGFVNSGVTYGVAADIRESGIPLVITTAGADDLTQRDAVDNIFRLSYTSSQDAMPMGNHACRVLGYDSMAIIGLDYAFGWEAASGFAKAYEDAGCDVVQEIYAALGTNDWGPFVQQVDAGVDAVWAVAPGSDGIRLVQAYRDFGVEQPLIGHGSTTDEQLLSEQQDAAEGVVTTLHYSAAIDTEENRAFVETFEEAVGRSVSQYAEHGWATAQVLEAALEAIEGEVTRQALVDAIAEVAVDAPRGPLRFDDYGQAIYTVYVRRVAEVDGQWVNEVIDSYPDTSQFWTYDPQAFLSEPPLAELQGTWE